jgi:quercetin dioxygenase-like cupin family protein
VTKARYLMLALLVLAANPPAGAAGDAPIHAHHGDVNLKWGPCPPVFPQGCEIAVTQGDPAREHADVFLRVPAGYAIPPHRHTSPEHMTLAAGELEVTYSGQKPFTMRVGSFAYGPAKLPHTARCTSKMPCVLSIAFESAVDAEAAAMTD